MIGLRKETVEHERRAKTLYDSVDAIFLGAIERVLDIFSSLYGISVQCVMSIIMMLLPGRLRDINIFISIVLRSPYIIYFLILESSGQYAWAASVMYYHCSRLQPIKHHSLFCNFIKGRRSLVSGRRLLSAQMVPGSMGNGLTNQPISSRRARLSVSLMIPEKNNK